MTKILHFVKRGDQRKRAGKQVYVVGKDEGQLWVGTYMKGKPDVGEER